MRIKREEFMKELLEEQQFRKLVRKGIRMITERKDEEQQLCSIIKQLVSEAKAKNIAIHDTTGMNQLELLFSNTSFLDTLEKAYTSLTSNPEQRKSFRAHLLNAVESFLQFDELNRGADVEEGAPSTLMSTPVAAEALDEANINIEIDDEIENPGRTEEEREEEDFTIPGLDETGRNIALKAFNGIKDLIANALKPIVDSRDQELFKTYLLKNINLFLDLYERRITGNIPQTPAPVV